MTAPDLARIVAAIERDAADERRLDDAPWSAGDGNMVYDCDNRPLILWGGEPPDALARARNRWPLYLALALECAKASKLPPGVWFALATLAPAPEVPDA